MSETIDAAHSYARLAAEYLTLATAAIDVTRQSAGRKAVTKFEKKSSGGGGNDLARSHLNQGISLARRALSVIRELGVDA